MSWCFITVDTFAAPEDFTQFSMKSLVIVEKPQASS
jgi:hypothetical protein